jgi:hypothetical protein
LPSRGLQADGAQQAPSAGDGTVGWLDGRAGAAGNVYAADISSLGGDDQPGVPKWIGQNVLTLFLAAFQQLGVFTEVSYSTDGGQTATGRPWPTWLRCRCRARASTTWL